MQRAQDLVLYMFPSCPYCQKVLHFMEEHNIEIPTRDITKPQIAAEMVALTGGETQVPCLAIDGKPLWESAEIIEFLRAL